MKNAHMEEVSLLMEVKKLKSDLGFYRVKIETENDIDIIANFIIKDYNLALDSMEGNIYDCCHRFNECSNAKSCINPDLIHDIGCSYRKKLRKDIMFFGINRNV